MNIQSLTSDIAGMARHAIDDVGDTLEHGRDAGAASVTAMLDTTSRRVRTLASVVGAYASLRTLMAAVEMADPGRRMLGAVGLQRRPSVLSRVVVGAGLVTVGAAVGAGVMLFLTPRTGPQMRQQVSRGIRSIKLDAEEVVDDVQEAAHHAVEAVEHTAQSAMSGVANAVHGASTPGVGARPDGARPDGAKAARADAPGRSHRAPRA